MASHGSIEQIVGALAFLGAGGYLLFRVGCDLVDGLASRNWYTTSGVIMVSDLQRSSGTSGGWTYSAEITYHYAVNGAEFTGSHAKCGDELGTSWAAPAARLVRKYRVGMEVRVRYDPEHPENSVLEPGVMGTVWISLPVGVLSIIAGANIAAQLFS